MSNRRNRAAKRTQQGPQPKPQGALEPGWPLRAVLSWDKKAGIWGNSPLSPGGGSEQHYTQSKWTNVSSKCNFPLSSRGHIPETEDVTDPVCFSEPGYTGQRPLTGPWTGCVWVSHVRFSKLEFLSFFFFKNKYVQQELTQYCDAIILQ